MNDHDNNTNELYKKLETMDKPSLKMYENAARLLKFAVALAAVSLLLFSMFFPTILVILAVGAMVFMLVPMHTNMAEALVVIRKNLAKFDKS